MSVVYAEFFCVQPTLYGTKYETEFEGSVVRVRVKVFLDKLVSGVGGPALLGP